MGVFQRLGVIFLALSFLGMYSMHPKRERWAAIRTSDADLFYREPDVRWAVDTVYGYNRTVALQVQQTLMCRGKSIRWEDNLLLGPEGFYTMECLFILNNACARARGGMNKQNISEFGESITTRLHYSYASQGWDSVGFGERICTFLGCLNAKTADFYRVPYLDTIPRMKEYRAVRRKGLELKKRGRCSCMQSFFHSMGKAFFRKPSGSSLAGRNGEYELAFIDWEIQRKERLHGLVYWALRTSPLRREVKEHICRFVN